MSQLLLIHYYTLFVLLIIIHEADFSKENTMEDFSHFIERKYKSQLVENSVNSSWTVQNDTDGLIITHSGSVINDLYHFYPVWAPFPFLKGEFSFDMTLPTEARCAIFSFSVPGQPCQEPGLADDLIMANYFYRQHFRLIQQGCGYQGTKKDTEKPNDHYSCKELSDNYVSCKGEVVQQNYDTIHYKPRGSLSSECNDQGEPTINFKGTVFNVTMKIYNRTTCQRLESDSSCSGIMEYAAYPNQAGMYANEVKAIGQLDSLDLSLEQIIALTTGTEPCFPIFDFTELLCHALNYGCEHGGRTSELIVMCKEMCKDIITSCMHEAKVIDFAVQDFMCDYFPFRNESNCYYYDASCPDLPEVQNAYVTNSRDMPEDLKQPGNGYPPLSKITYACKPGFMMEGDNTTECSFTSKWSTLPKCVSTDTGMQPGILALAIMVPLVILTLMIIFLLWLWRKKLRSNGENDIELQRQKEYDVFLSYYDDRDKENPEQYNRAQNTFIRFLQRNCNPPFKVITHSKLDQGNEGINQKIQNSNRAIIILSAEYISDTGYMQIIEDCIQENANDPAYKCFVIFYDSSAKDDILQDRQMTLLNRFGEFLPGLCIPFSQETRIKKTLSSDRFYRKNIEDKNLFPDIEKFLRDNPKKKDGSLKR